MLKVNGRTIEADFRPLATILLHILKDSCSSTRQLVSIHGGFLPSFFIRLFVLLIGRFCLFMFVSCIIRDCLCGSDMHMWMCMRMLRWYLRTWNYLVWYFHPASFSHLGLLSQKDSCCVETLEEIYGWNRLPFSWIMEVVDDRWIVFIIRMSHFSLHGHSS